MKIEFDRKIGGVLVPVFALRTEEDLGVGDTEGVKQMVDWCARHGFRVLQVLPINETAADHSPYNALSALALEPTTIAVSPQHLPGLSSARFDALLDATTVAALRSGPVRYGPVKELKRKLLEAAFIGCESDPRWRADLRAFSSAHRKWLADYCLFRALMERQGGSPAWERWPAAHRSPARARAWVRSLPPSQRADWDRRERFFAWVQYVAHRQWAQVRAHAEARGVALVGDLPFGVSRHSADVWANRELFDLQWSGGAPPERAFAPDEFTKKWGQNWGVPLYRWEVHRRSDYAWWRLRVRSLAAIFHAFRVDHVLGFYRLYAFPWRPEDNGRFTDLDREAAAKETGGRLPRFWPHGDDSERHRRANCARGEKILRMVLEAAGQARVIAEDLGVVPEYVRPSLARLGIPGFVIPHWERNPDYTWKDPAGYPPLSVVTPATHDHEPLAAQWESLWREHEQARARQDHHGAHVSWLELQRFVWWCGWDGNHIPRQFTAALHEAYCRRLFGAPSWLAVLLISDVFAQTTRFNVPGPMAESNWTQRLDRPVSQLDHDPLLGERARSLARLLAESGRA